MYPQGRTRASAGPHTRTNLPDPMNHIKIFKGQPRRFAFGSWQLTETKHFRVIIMIRWNQMEINNSTALRNKKPKVRRTQIDKIIGLFCKRAL